VIRLLSKALVGFTIEFDNEFEHQMPNRTASKKPTVVPRGSPWLTSQVMWSNVMQYVPDAGITVADLRNVARSNRLLLGGLERWRYVTIDPTSSTSGSQKPLRPDAVVAPTDGGRKAQKIWGPLGRNIEQRWRERFGASNVEKLRDSLTALIAESGSNLPEYLPIVFPTQTGKAEVPPSGDFREFDPATRDISALLSKVLHAFTLEFEKDFRISMTVGANTLRVLNPHGVRVKDLPALTGVSKEGNAMCTGLFERSGIAVVEPDPNAQRWKVIKLTDKGIRAQAGFERQYTATVDEWKDRFDVEAIEALRNNLLRIVGEDKTSEESVFLGGLKPYPDNWRASIRRPATLPHYPMVLHRGGYPDGS
jgi:hypothetical protein